MYTSGQLPFVDGKLPAHRQGRRRRQRRGRGGGAGPHLRAERARRRRVGRRRARRDHPDREGDGFVSSAPDFTGQAQVIERGERVPHRGVRRCGAARPQRHRDVGAAARLAGRGRADRRSTPVRIQLNWFDEKLARRIEAIEADRLIPADARNAATVMVVRDSPASAGVEVLMLQAAELRCCSPRAPTCSPAARSTRQTARRRSPGTVRTPRSSAGNSGRPRNWLGHSCARLCARPSRKQACCWPGRLMVRSSCPTGRPGKQTARRSPMAR